MKSIFNKLVGDRKQEGKQIKVGNYQVHITKQIAEGGFSYVFLCKDNHNKQYALKRVLTHDDEELLHVKQEIAVMKKLSETDHKNIVKFYDSVVLPSAKQADTSEVYILMEYCSGGHLVDIMNSKPQKFSEQDIFSIFYDICMAVAHMHAQDPPMAHRDLKVENVLLDEHTGAFKLCDFGSVTTVRLRPNNKHEIGAAEEEIQKHTTLQYRAPEMIDLYQHKLISEKVDIWALGCILYKLAFYKTPFEDAGTLQILNVDYTIPADSKYSSNLHNLIRLMLNADPDARPDIFDVIDEVCRLRNISPPPRPKRNSGNMQSPPEIHTSAPASPVHVHTPIHAPSTPVHTPVHTPAHSPAHSPKPSPKPSPLNSPVQLHLHHHQNQQQNNSESNQNHNIATTPSNHSGGNLHVQNNHLAPPPSTTLQTSQSAHGISPRSPASSERGHRRTLSTTERSPNPSVEQLRGRPALTSSSPAIAPPSSSSSSTPFLQPPSSTAHLHVRRRGKSDDAENPFASPFISPVVSPSITAAPYLDTNGTIGGGGEHKEHKEHKERREREGEGEGESDGQSVEAHVKAVTDSSKAVPDNHHLNRIIAITHETHTCQPILDVVMRQPLTNAFVCLKALSLVHTLMQEGHPQVLIDLVNSAQLYNNLYLGWTKHADRAPEMAPVLALHAQAVYRKIMYHQKHPALDGKLKNTSIVPSSQLMSGLLESLADIIKIQPHISSAIFVCPEDLLSHALTPLVNEAINIYNFLNCHLSSEALEKPSTTSPPPPAQFSSSFSSQLSELQQFFKLLPQTLPTLSSSHISFPSITVPNNPFGEDTFVNPFAAAPSKFDPFFSPPEEPLPIPKSPLPQSPLSKSGSVFPRTSSLQVIPSYSSPPHSPASSPSAPRFALTPALSPSVTPLQRSTSLLTASLYMARNNFEELSLDGSTGVGAMSSSHSPGSLTSSGHIPPPTNLSLQQQQAQQQHLQQQLQNLQQQQQQGLQGPENTVPRPIPSAFVNPNMASMDHGTLAGNLSPRVKARDMPTLNQPPQARRSNAHRRAQSNTADDIVRRLDPSQLNNIRTASLLNQGSPVKRT